MKHIFLYPILIALLLSSCAKQQYVISSIQGEYITVGQATHPDPKMVALVDGYKKQLDDKMNRVIGYAEQYMDKDRPEGLLNNFTSDVLLHLDKKYTQGQDIDLSFVNIGGLRAPIANGNITVGDIYSTYPFENALVVVRLKGKYLNELFESYARLPGGISSTGRLLIKNKKLIDAKVNGQPVDANKIYTIVTLDYLAEGNDGMDALKNAESVTLTGATLRDYILDYIVAETAKGNKIKVQTDGRIAEQ